VPRLGRKPSPPRHGEGKGILVSLSADLSIDLHAFCEAHYGASQSRVMCEALQDFIARRLEAEPQMRLRFKAAQERLARPVAEIVRISDPAAKLDQSGQG
jgi:hypothetical protein